MYRCLYSTIISRQSLLTNMIKRYLDDRTVSLETIRGFKVYFSFYANIQLHIFTEFFYNSDISICQPWNCFRGVGLDSYKSALCLRSRGKIKTLPACQVGRHAAYNVVHASNSAARSPLDFDDSAQDRLSEVRSFLASCLQLLTLNWQFVGLQVVTMARCEFQGFNSQENYVSRNKMYDVIL